MNELRRTNMQSIKDNKSCQQLINDLMKIEEFLDDLVYLLFGRDAIFIKLKYVIDVSDILQSSYITLSSCIECCKCGCFADANTLLRKYRDDLFFILYILVYKDTPRFNKKTC